MRSVIKPTSMLAAILSLCGCLDYEGIVGGGLSRNIKQNASACDSGYREACIRLLESGCTPGTNWPVCQFAVDARSKVAASLEAKCSTGDDGACYTIAKAACGTGDASACSMLKEIDPAILERECTRGDQLACADPPPGVYAAAAMTVAHQWKDGRDHCARPLRSTDYVYPRTHVD